MLLGDRGDCGSLGRRERAEKKFDIFPQDEIASDTYSLVGVALGVPHNELNLAIENPTFCVDLLHEHLCAFQRGLANERPRAGKDHGITNSNWLLRCCRTGKGNGEDRSQWSDPLAQVHISSPMVVFRMATNFIVIRKTVICGGPTVNGARRGSRRHFPCKADATG